MKWLVLWLAGCAGVAETGDSDGTTDSETGNTADEDSTTEDSGLSDSDTASNDSDTAAVADSGDSDSDAAGDSDVGGDSDPGTEGGDSDSDLEDTESEDTDIEVPASPWSGTVSFLQRVDGQVNCEADIEFWASPVTDCPTCDFAFSVDASQATFGPSTQCDPSADAAFSLVRPDEALDLQFWYSHELWDNVPTEVLMANLVTIDGPEPFFVAYDQGSGADLDWSANTLEWTTEWQGIRYEHLREKTGGECEDTLEPTVATVGGTPVTEDLPCDPDPEAWVDLWRFDAAAGATVGIGVDTVDDATAGYQYAWVNGPDECTVVYGAYGDECTYLGNAVYPYDCPEFEFVAPTTGTYELVVLSIACGWNNPLPAHSYSVQVEGAVSATPVLYQDDVPDLLQHSIEIEASGQAVWTP